MAWYLGLLWLEQSGNGSKDLLSLGGLTQAARSNVVPVFVGFLYRAHRRSHHNTPRTLQALPFAEACPRGRMPSFWAGREHWLEGAEA